MPAPSGWPAQVPFVAGDTGWVYCGLLRPCRISWAPQQRVQVIVGAARTSAMVEWREGDRIRRHTLQPREVWLVGGGVEHQLHWHHTAPVLVCLFRLPWVQALLGGEDCPTGVYPLQDLINCEVTLGLITDDLQSEEPKFPEHRLAAATAWTAYVFRALRTLDIRSPTAADQRWAEIRPRLDAFLQAHLADPFSLDHVAKAVGLSRWHLSAVFKARTTVTLRHYFNRLRVLRAKELLQAGRTVTEVMEELGFCDPWKFRRTFRQHLKRDPGYFRSQSRQS